MATITITIHIDESDGPSASTDSKLDAILKGEKKIMANVQDLQQKVANATTVEESAVTLIQGLSQQLRDNATDPAAIQAMADQLDGATADLSAAITANTPADTGGGSSSGATGATGGDAGSSSGSDTSGSSSGADTGGSSGSGDVTTTTSDPNAGDGTATSDPTSSSAPAGDTGDSGQSALDPTVSPAAGEQATGDQASVTGTGDGTTVTP